MSSGSWWRVHKSNTMVVSDWDYNYDSSFIRAQNML